MKLMNLKTYIKTKDSYWAGYDNWAHQNNTDGLKVTTQPQSSKYKIDEFLTEQSPPIETKIIISEIQRKKCYVLYTNQAYMSLKQQTSLLLLYSNKGSIQISLYFPHSFITLLSLIHWSEILVILIYHIYLQTRWTSW